MALTKVSRSLLNTGVADASDATAISIDSSENVTLAGDLDLADSKKIKLGGSDDLQIYHDGSNSFINEGGTGGLKILSGDVYIRNPSDEDMIHATSGGAVRLYYDNASRLYTHTSGVKLDEHLYLADSKKIFLGAGDDLSIYHDGSNSYIEDSGTGDLYLSAADNFIVRKYGGSEVMIKGTADGAAELYYDDSKKLETVTGGVTVTGTLTATSLAGNVTTAAQTGITSLLATDIKIGEDDQTKIDFETADEIHFYAANAHQVKLIDGAIVPVTDNDIDLGTSSLEFKDAYFDGTVTSDAFAGPLTGDVTGNVSGTAATVTTAAQTNITSLGTLTTLTVDEITINADTITATDDFIIDAVGDITLDADGGDIKFQDGTVDIFSIINSSSDVQLKAAVQDKDMIFRGNDGGTIFTALTLDMSEAGAATFNNKIVATELDISGNVDIDGTLETDNLTVGGAQGSDGQLLTSTGSGVAWEDAPSSGPTHKTFGTASIMIGDNATGTIDAADNNTGVGVDIFAALTTGDNNTTVGFQGLGATTTGSANAAFGTYALDANTTGDSNTAIGYGTLTNAQTADANTAVGRNALLSNSGGADNTAVGAYALDANTSGAYNTAVGRNALTANVDGSRSTAVGYGSLAAHDPSSATDTYNTAVGFHALNATTTPSNNTAVGGNALAVNTTGTVNVAVGSGALAANTTASSNTAVGHNALTANTTGSANVAVGKDAGEAVTTGTYNTFVGYLAGTNVTTSNDNTAFGSEALRDTTTGAGNTAIGSEALVVNSGDNNTAVGMNSLVSNTSGDDNVAIGKGAMSSNTTGANNTGLGRAALSSNTTADSNTAVGYQALTANTTGTLNTAVGVSALTANTTANSNTAIGDIALTTNTTGAANVAVGRNALGANTTASNNVAVGHGALESNTEGTSNTAVGYQALDSNTTANQNTAVGYSAGSAITTAVQNVTIGDSALSALTTGHYNIAIGSQAGAALVAGTENTFVGLLSGRYTGGTDHPDYNCGFGSRTLYACTTGERNVAVGAYALNALTTAADNTAVGYGALQTTNGTRNMGIGYRALTAQSGSADNIAIGYDALVRQTTGANGNIAIGNYAGRAVVSSASTSQLLAIGHHVASHASAAMAGYQNCFVGYNIASATGLAGAFRNTALGANALTDLTTGDNNTTLGNMAGNSITTATNNLCLGYQAGESGSPSGTLTTGSNTIVLGDDNIGALYCTQSSINTSDRRDKADITNFTDGLDFIKKMQPVTYKWDRRSWYLPRDEEGNITDEDITKVTPDGSKKENVTHVGFIAQDVETLEKEIGFASDNTNRLLTNLTEDGNRYGMKYERLVTVLVNAVKDLSTKLDAAETRIKTLEDA